MRLIIGAAVLGAIIIAVFFAAREPTRSTAVQSHSVQAQPTAQERPVASAPTSQAPRVHYSVETPAPEVMVNRSGTDGSMDFKQRAQLVSKWDEWIRSTGVNAEQQAKVLAVLANAKANYDAARGEAKNLDSDDEDAFVDLVSGLHIQDDMETELGEILTPEQHRVWKRKLGIVALLFAPNVKFLVASPPRRAD